jgi:1-acyl-sn-glycerol-3-phosphate acyltransferase
VPDAPSAARLDRLTSLLGPLQLITRPYVDGLDRLPSEGAFYAGNHSSFAVLDAPFMIAELWQRRGIAVRPIGDHGHYAVPVWREAIEAAGVIRGTRANVGGAAEVFRPRGHKYELMWKERLGFAKLAIEFGYPMVPFAAVGAEEMLDIVVDSSTPGFDQLSSAIRSLGGWGLPPIPLGVGPTLIPRFQRLYFSFRDPVDTSRFGGDASDANAAIVRDEVRAAVVEGLDEMRRFRSVDPERRLGRAVLGVPKRPAKLIGEGHKREVVTRAVDVWNHLGPRGLAPLLDRRVRLMDSREWPGAALWWGRNAVIERITSLLKAYDVRAVRATAIDDLDEGRVAVTLQATPPGGPVLEARLRVTISAGAIQLIEPLPRAER